MIAMILNLRFLWLFRRAKNSFITQSNYLLGFVVVAELTVRYDYTAVNRSQTQYKSTFVIRLYS